MVVVHDVLDLYVFCDQPKLDRMYESEMKNIDNILIEGKTNQQTREPTSEWVSEVPTCRRCCWLASKYPG